MSVPQRRRRTRATTCEKWFRQPRLHARDTFARFSKECWLFAATSGMAQRLNFSLAPAVDRPDVAGGAPRRSCGRGERTRARVGEKDSGDAEAIPSPVPGGDRGCLYCSRRIRPLARVRCRDVARPIRRCRARDHPDRPRQCGGCASDLPAGVRIVAASGPRRREAVRGRDRSVRLGGGGPSSRVAATASYGRRACGV
jgi:hypothetical protein